MNGSLPKNTRISVKPSQIGLLLGEKIYFQNLLKIGRECVSHNIPLEIDIEEHNLIGRTINLSKQLKTILPKINLRQALPVKYEQTDKYLEQLAYIKINARLCKGAYRIPRQLSVPKKYIIERFINHAQYGGVNYKTELATHDQRIIEKVKRPYQFLFGFQKRKANKLVKNKGQVTIYIPFGKNWEYYGIRRLPYILKHFPNIIYDDFMIFLDKIIRRIAFALTSYGGPKEV